VTATDLHAQALALIAERRELIAAGTPGPWFHFYADQCCRYPCITRDSTSGGLHNLDCSHADAALIVAAVNDYGPLLDLPEAVLLANPFHEHPNELARAALRSLGLEVDR
jgi:hypothetical protein